MTSVPEQSQHEPVAGWIFSRTCERKVKCVCYFLGQCLLLWTFQVLLWVSGQPKSPCDGQTGSTPLTLQIPQLELFTLVMNPKLRQCWKWRYLRVSRDRHSRLDRVGCQWHSGKCSLSVSGYWMMLRFIRGGYTNWEQGIWHRSSVPNNGNNIRKLDESGWLQK